MSRVRTALFALLSLAAHAASGADAAAKIVRRFPLDKSGLEITARAQRSRFLDVVGRRSAFFGYEGRPLEAWVYPLKLVDDFELSFRLRDYPQEIQGRDVIAQIEVRPEATVLVYSHAAFTVRQVLFAPIDAPGLVALLDIDSVLPMTVTGTFRPRLALMWPAGLMTPNVDWDEKAHVYRLTEESQRFVGILGSPGARDLSVMPYQEEPKDLPLRFEIAPTPEATRAGYLPIVFAGSVKGKDEAKAAYDRILESVESLYAANVAHYRGLAERTLRIETPDPKLDESFAWAKVGIDKGLATNPGLGTGLLAGFRTSGDSERPGFAWFFGRDALWTAFALHAYGDFKAARDALDFLRRVQRADGKVPHEISQSAPWLPWFTDYSYPWNSADATPLFVVAHADHFRSSGDRPFLDAAWDAIVKAWRFSAATDTDGNGLVENTSFGHGWVEGGDLHPPHEEIYQQGAWIEACRGLAELADVRGERALAEEARARAAQTLAAVEKTYWLADRGFYAFATLRPRAGAEAERGPERSRRQLRLEELTRRGGLVDEDTVMPAVTLSWGHLDPARAQSQLDHLGAAAQATDWGSRLLSDQSALYDPLSYHHGSVWPLFTGWTALAGYRYGRPHIGYQALRANADLRSASALGYVTELLSGDYKAAFGRSSHHQLWSEAMVAAPLVRGLLGLSVEEGGRTLRFAPQLPADWDRVAARGLPVGACRVDVSLVRKPGQDTITFVRRTSTGAPCPGAGSRFLVAPSYPRDAQLLSAMVAGRSARFTASELGDVQRAELAVLSDAAEVGIVIRYRPGTEAFVNVVPAEAGERSGGVRLLRSRADADGMSLVLEGRAGRSYRVQVRTPRRPVAAPGTTVRPLTPDTYALEVPFEGSDSAYVRRELVLPLR
ncbi:MAG TPA: amylo-alpha-1,6-glucosidase [Vicinamibacteria bacterium]